MLASRSRSLFAVLGMSALVPLTGCAGGSGLSTPSSSANSVIPALSAASSAGHRAAGSDDACPVATPHAGWPVALSLITNGDFATAPLPAGWNEYAAPAVIAPTTWQVGLDSIDLVGITYWGVGSNTPGNECSVDLDGKADGSISQNFPTTIGKWYRVQFQLSGSGAGLPVINSLQVSVDSVPAQSMNFAWNNANNHDVYHNKWKKQKWTFKATAQTTTLTIASTDNPQSASGAVVTEIAVCCKP